MKTDQGILVADDDFVRPPGFEQHGMGYTGRDYKAFPLNGHSFCQASTIKRLSEQEIIELIDEKTANKSWLADLADRVGSIVKDQGQSSYCWAHAPTRGMEYCHFMTGADVLVFSAFYTAWPIKHGSNTGGSGIQAVESLVKHGTCVESLVPPQTFHVHETPEIIANGLLHRIEIYEEMPPDDVQLHWSSLCQDQGITVGIPNWDPGEGHEVFPSKLMFKGGQKDFGSIRPVADNSWSVKFGDHGRIMLDGRRCVFDEVGRIASIKQSAT